MFKHLWSKAWYLDSSISDLWGCQKCTNAGPNADHLSQQLWRWDSASCALTSPLARSGENSDLKSVGNLRTEWRSEYWIQADFGRKNTRWRRKWGSILFRNRNENELWSVWCPWKESRYLQTLSLLYSVPGGTWPPASGSGLSSARCAEVPLCHPSDKGGCLPHCIFEVEKGAKTLADGEDGEGLFI